MNQQHLSPNVRQLIWAALTFQVVIYAIVGWHLTPTEAGPASFTLCVSLTSAGLCLTLLALGLTPILAPRTDYTTFGVIRWALAETPAVFGLILYLLGATLPWFVGCLVLGLLGLLMTAPGEKERRAYLQAGGKR